MPLWTRAEEAADVGSVTCTVAPVRVVMERPQRARGEDEAKHRGKRGDHGDHGESVARVVESPDNSQREELEKRAAFEGAREMKRKCWELTSENNHLWAFHTWTF